ncbi:MULTISPECIES: MaoC/PaaZ C-terminal domain-containing protein [unclassified Rhodococcus (in: high G+C Gram-positive bacteria)]|uniref:MaoC/PaaZ C-terminal domain-containing protein n=2 Tax=unclassified Rhodococcus (in: high G+C Gram-positive bacteria) TaxID=192944 RepID=UPI0021BF4BF5|nr:MULTISPECIES: MaoC/PaaZ C-terminal domain-containing protein [unclassified Rhodococcus (in: high G+C Gram-positive bacteria)]
MMSSNTFEVAVGQSVPPFERTTGFANWNRFAAVNHEFVDIHMDDEAGRAAGYDSAFGMGNLLWSYLHCMLRDWIGDAGRIREVRCQFRSPNTKGMKLTAGGTVTAVRDDAGRRLVDLDIWISDSNGTVLTPGSATVELVD